MVCFIMVTCISSARQIIESNHEKEKEKVDIYYNLWNKSEVLEMFWNSEKRLDNRYRTSPMQSVVLDSKKNKD